MKCFNTRMTYIHEGQTQTAKYQYLRMMNKMQFNKWFSISFKFHIKTISNSVLFYSPTQNPLSKIKHESIYHKNKPSCKWSDRKLALNKTVKH